MDILWTIENLWFCTNSWLNFFIILLYKYLIIDSRTKQRWIIEFFSNLIYSENCKIGHSMFILHYYSGPLSWTYHRRTLPIVNKRQSFATSPEKVKDLKINSEVTKHETKSHKYTIFSKDTTRVSAESNSGSSPNWEIVCQC